MNEALAEHGEMSLSSLRLLVSPLRLMSAALWAVLQHRAVMHYGLLEDFISAVLDIIPGLLSPSDRAQLVLGLRAKVVLQMCHSEDICYRQDIESHLTRMNDLIHEEEASSSKMKVSVDNFSKMVNTLMDDPYERHMFYQTTFPSVFGINFDSALCALVRKFLINLETLIPVPSLDQTSLWLGLSSSVLKECGDILNQPEPFSKLIHLHSKHKMISPGRSVDDDFIFSSFSGFTNDDVEADTDTQSNSSNPKEEENNIVTEVEVTLNEADADPQDCNASVEFAYQRLPDSSITFRCLVCGQGFCSLFELKRHSISGCSANTVKDKTSNLPCKKEVEEAESGPSEALQQSWSLDTSEGQTSKRSSRVKTCSVCGETFASSTDLMNHMRTHVENGSHICGQCGEEFDTYETYTLHQENVCKRSGVHAMDVDYGQDMSDGLKDMKECAVILRRVSDDKGTTKNHPKKRAIMTRPPDLTMIKACYFSVNKDNKKLTETDSEPQLDQKSKEAQILLKCTLCDETFSKLVLMRKHYHESHQVKGSFQCPVCKRVFVRLSDLVNHHQNKLLVQCDTCKRCFISFLKLNKHRETYKDACAAQHICEICDKNFKDAFRLKKHENAHKTEKTTVCSYCGKNFSNKSSLQIHMNRHTGGFSCPICAKVFFQNTALQRHLDRHNGQEPYLCEICGKGWATKAYLMLHMARHSEERPFKCDQCSMTYKWESHLKSHVRNKHTEHRPFECNVCSKAFKASAILKQHMKRHTGVRPFVCSRCGKSYHKRYELKNHIQRACL